MEVITKGPRVFRAVLRRALGSLGLCTTKSFMILGSPMEDEICVMRVSPPEGLNRQFNPNFAWIPMTELKRRLAHSLIFKTDTKNTKFAKRTCAHRNSVLWNPIGDKDVEFPRLLPVPCRCKDELFAIAGEHRKAVEPGVIG
jgi:hypothetical protein